MSEPESMSPMPRAIVLGYLTNGGEPTRVRVIASKGLLIVGAMSLVSVMALVLNALYVSSPVPFHWYNRSPYDWEALCESVRDRDWHEAFSIAADYYLCEILVIPLITVAGILQFVLAPGVQWGRQRAGSIAWWSLMPLGLCVVVGAGGMGAAAVVFGVGLFGKAAPDIAVWLVIGAIVAGFATLLINDLASYLRWIARNPGMEKPAEAFLPRAN